MTLHALDKDKVHVSSEALMVQWYIQLYTASFCTNKLYTT